MFFRFVFKAINTKLLMTPAYTTLFEAMKPIFKLSVLPLNMVFP